MSNKKGFIFIETIITIVVLAAALLYIYANFNDILIKEKTRIYYDDISYIYRNYYVKELFLGSGLASIVNSVNNDNPMVMIGCQTPGLLNDENKEICNNLQASLDITRIVIAIDDLSYIKKCDDDSSKCNYLNYFSDSEISYFKTLGKLETKSNHIMIIEYSHVYNATNITRHYAWIEL